MNEEKERSNDLPILESASLVASAAGGAYFFGGEGLNNAILKSNIYMKTVSELIRDNSDDLSELSIAKFENAMDNAKAEYETIKNIGSKSFRAKNTDAMNILQEFYQNQIDENKMYRYVYNQEAQGIAFKVLEKNKGKISEEAYSKLQSLIPTIVRNSKLDENGLLQDGKFMNVKTELAKTLDIHYADAISTVTGIMQEVGIWMNENPYGDWISENGSSIKESLDEAMTNYKARYLEQEEGRSIAEKTRRMLNSDSPVTIDFLMDYYKNGSPEEKRRLRDLFSRDFMAINDSGIEIGDQGKHVGYSQLGYLDLIEKEIDRLSEGSTYFQQATDEEREKILEKRKYFGMLEINGLRVNQEGKIYTISDIEHSSKNFIKNIFKLFPFNMFHANEVLLNKERRSSYVQMDIGKLNPLFSDILGGDGVFTNKVAVVIGGEIYAKEGNKFVKINNVPKNFALISTEIGVGKSVLRKYAEGRANKEYQNAIDIEMNGGIKSKKPFYKIDFGLKHPSKIDNDPRFGNHAALFDRRSKNFWLDTWDTELLKDKDTPVRMAAYFKGFYNFLKENTFSISALSAKKLKKGFSASSNDTIKYLDLLIKADDETQVEDVIKELLDVGDVENTYHNHGLAKIVRDYSEDPKLTLTKYEVGKDIYRTSKGTYKSKDFKDLLKEELEKEFFFRLKSEDKISYNDIFKTLNESLQGDERMLAKNLVAVSEYVKQSGVTAWNSGNSRDNFRRFEKRMRKFHENDEFKPLIFQLESLIDRFSGIGNEPSIYDQVFNDNIEDVGESMMDSVRYSSSRFALIRGFGLNQFYKDSKTFGLNLLKEMNEGHFEKAANLAGKTFWKAGKTFFAGMESREDFSVLSLGLSHLMNRVNTGANAVFGDFGIFETSWKLNQGFEGKDVHGGGALLRKFLTKRVLPVGLAIGAYNIIEDLTKNSIGISPTEATVSAGGNTWLGVKKITGFVGLDKGLKSLTRDNALFNYLELGGGGDGEWQTYEEKKHYYEKGYDPIRKSRFWLFGSSNEFRGGKISYWEPNTYRMLKSDYLNKSLYNNNIINKYNPFISLEELHYNDRPYPIAGAPFDDMTPWGVVLNPVAEEIFGIGRHKMHEDRLQNGVDIKALMWHMNQQIRDHAQNNNNFYLQGGRLNSVIFNAYNAPTYDENIITGTSDNKRWFNQYQKFNGAISLSEINGEEPIYGETLSTYTDPYLRNKVTLKDKIETEAAAGNSIAEMASIVIGHPSLDIIQRNNEKIINKAQSWDNEIKTQGMTIQNKLSLERSDVEEMLKDKDRIAEMIEAGSASDYIKEASISMRMISGFYGYMAKKAIGFGANDEDRIATSQNMTSTSRWFWDQNFGGLGGEQMEIYRRFFPEYKRFQTINPLMNEMPDWMPERFRFGDPYTAVPKGEARMPGIGYESLNELHPDIFGEYGAFDRFKILADVAAFSPEYKFWKRVAEKTVTDPELREEMNEVKERVREQSKQHDFMDYKYVGRNFQSSRFYISEVLQGGQFKVFGSDEIFKMAGISVKANSQEDTQQVLSRYLSVGQLVTVITDINEAYGRNNDKAQSINAAVKIDGENVSQMMIETGDAKKRKGDVSAPAYMADHGTMINGINYITEALMHMDIPIIHSRWLRANDALEDYQDDYIYGTSFQSWDDILQTFIIPNMNKAASSNFWTAAGISADIIKRNALHGTSDKNNIISNFIADGIDFRKLANREDDFADLSTKEIPFPIKKISLPTHARIATTAMKFHRAVDRGALMGWLTAKFTRFGSSGVNEIGETVGERMGSAITLGYTATMAPQNFSSVMAATRLGWLVGEHFGKYKKPITIASAAISSIRWAESKTGLSENSDAFIPDSVKKRWDMQDYFDRLTYIKYMGLFEKASEKALEEEGVDIKNIVLKQEREKDDIKDTKRYLTEAIEKLRNIQSEKAMEQRQYLQERLNGLSPVKAMFSGGEYTKSAILYYNAAKSTMYGLDENSSMADVVRALPKNDREYFMNFVKEKDEEKRQEILKYVSPQIKRALKMFWYQDFEKPESNLDYFESHHLPAPTWGGFSPDVDIEDVKAKVIKNEAMTASDFGIYSSQYNEPGVINAPALDYRGSSDNIIIRQLKLFTELKGLGLTDVEVSVEPSEDSTLEVIANVSRVIPYNIGQSINNFFGDNL